MKKLVILLALFSIAGGCASMTPGQRELYLEACAEGESIASYPNTALAGILSILPGGGQFYNGQVALGLVNLLLWPLSYLWAIPSAIIDAGTIRKVRTAEAYLMEKRMRERRDRE